MCCRHQEFWPFCWGVVVVGLVVVGLLSWIS